MYKLKLLTFIIALTIINTTVGFTQNKTETPLAHKAGKFTLGANAGFGYNVINHVDGSLAVIPNNADPKPSPGSKVYSHPISMTIDAPFLTSEYWFSPAWSLRAETGMNMMVVGARHALADYAYLLSYWKVNFGGRFYLADAGVPALFFGLGWFANFPIAKPLIGFIEAETSGNIDTGPYVEFGTNYPITETISLEMYARFYFGIRPLTKLADPNILVDIAISPLDLVVGINWAI